MELPFKIDLSGEVAVVTGGTGVIGGMYARTLAACGAKVAVLGRNKENGAQVLQDIEADGGEAMAVAGNVLDKDSLLAARQEILDKWGHINILVNCAGGAIKAAQVPQDHFHEREEGTDTLFTIDLENVHKELDLNIYGTMLPTQVFGEVMVGQDNANIINISSMSAYHPLTRIPGYSAGKAGVASFTEWCAIYFAKSGIRVNAVAPGFFQTTQNHALHFNEDGTPKPRARHIIDATPMEKYGDPSDLIGALLYLVSPKGSNFVTGVVLPVDGAFHVYQGV
ncbi:SDR family NAD(P)-dependent oxidoreductase [Oribacterium sp. WCC10]|uniref:SDR family NAD(P)-dependent oxidoreductase n=1 Tax=Oribacterium sp. WCC10 TaxID=1855343 RepID=UPI0008F0E699|nr:SDR family NAD(P)-dependent oxidoreductase [Oribacterium sp. WCC10]SFG19090.1 NAD(P)-dependent dehydrogenase, short-chain alcohol dehydrogenase family [Oribacterium sp. WCC10]